MRGEKGRRGGRKEERRMGGEEGREGKAVESNCPPVF